MSWGEIPVGPFRDAFIKKYNADEMSLVDMAVALGRNKNETSYVQRLLGLRPEKYKEDYGLTLGGKPRTAKGTGTSRSREGQVGWRYRQKVEYKTAVRLAEILDLDPYEVEGL